MSHLAECVSLYRDDIAVDDALYARFLLDAHARDLADSANDQSDAPAEARDAVAFGNLAAAAFTPADGSDAFDPLRRSIADGLAALRDAGLPSAADR